MLYYKFQTIIMEFVTTSDSAGRQFLGFRHLLEETQVGSVDKQT